MNRIRTNAKRVSALLLAALLLAALLPIGGVAHAEAVVLDSYFEDYNGKKIGGTWDEDTGTLTLIALSDVTGLNSRTMNNFIHHSFGTAYSDYETKLKKVVFDTDVVAGPDDCKSLFVNCQSLADIDGLNRLDTRHATSMESMFRGCFVLRAADISNFRTENVTDISLMFTNCRELTSLDFSSFNTSKVTDTHQMFMDCKKLQSLDLHYFDTSSVTYMMGMFHNCEAMTSLNMTGWDTSEVTSFRVTFAGMKSMQSIDVSGFDTRSAEDMHGMFHTCSKVKTFDLRHFDVSNVKDMTSMFQECASLTSVNVSGWDTSKNEKFYAMFGNCSSLPSLDVSDFDTSSGTDFGYMFAGCEKLKELDITNFDTKKSTRNAHMFTGCTELKKLSVGAKFSNEVTSSTAIFPVAMYDSTTVNGNSPVKYAEEARVLSDAGVYVVGKEVTFNANGGTGTDQTQLFGYSLADKTLKSAADLGFSNGSKAFLGWNIESDGSGTAYNTTDPYNYNTAPEGVLYAQWESDATPTPTATPTETPTATPTPTTWAEGTIKLEFGFAYPGKYREAQYPKYAYTGWVLLPYWSGGSATLYDSAGQVVESYTNESRHEFKNLPAGEYTIKLDSLDEGIYSVFSGVHNGAPKSQILIWSEDSDLLRVTVTEGNTSTILRWVVLQYKVYGFKTVTDIGTFSAAPADSATPGAPSADGKAYTYYEGRSWAWEDYPDPVDYIPYAQTHDGIYYGDSASQYAGMTGLQVPTLSDAERALGYTFKGWRLEGDTSGRVYAESEALAHIVKGNVVFIAEWERPMHTVTFDANGGTPVDEQTVAHGATATEPADPTRDGHTFKGWTLNGADYVFTAPVTEDITLVAQWEATGTQTGPVISGGSLVMVYEAGLPAGTGVGNTQTTASAHITIDAPAGIDSIEIDGISVYRNGSLNVTTVSADCGVLAVTDFDASTGKLSYTFTLTGAIHSVVAIGFPERRFTVRVEDADGRQAEAFLTVGIEDDAPLAKDASHRISVGETAPINGDMTDAVQYGADGPAASGRFQWTDASGARYGAVTLRADGTYSYLLNNDDAAVLALAAGETLTESFGYTVTDAEGDTAEAKLIITIDGAPVQTKVKSTVHHHFWPIEQLSQAIAIGYGTASTRSKELTLGGMIGSDFDVPVGEKLEITVQNLTLVGDVLRSLKGTTIGEGATLAGYKPYEDTTKWIVFAIYCDNADFTDDATDAEHRLSFTVEDAAASGSTPTYPMHGVNTIDIYYVPAAVFSLTKVWADRDNAEDTRPETVDVAIYTVAEADATETWMPAADDAPTKAVTLKASEGWKADVALPAPESGYTFVVRETEQDRYRVIYEGDTENGFTITNVLKPGPFSLSYGTDGNGEVTDWMLRGDVNDDRMVQTDEWSPMRDIILELGDQTLEDVSERIKENMNVDRSFGVNDPDWIAMRNFQLALLYPQMHLLPLSVGHVALDFRVVDTPEAGYHVSEVTVNGHVLSVPQKGESAQTTEDGVTYTVAVDANGVATVTGLSLEKNDVRFKHAPDEVLCTLTFILNGGTMEGQTGTVEKQVAVGETIQMPEPTRDDYTFLYWQGSVHYAGDDYTAEGDHTFRAQWEATATPTPTPATPTATPAPTDAPTTATPAPTATSGNTPAPTDAPTTATPAPTDAPATATPAPTAEPTATPKPTKTPDKDTPRTSDDSHPLLWTLLLIGSLLSCTAMLFAERRRVRR